MRTVQISDETFEKLKDQLLEEEKVDLNTYDDLIGKKWFFRTVTYHLVGKAVKRIGSFIQLEISSWVADSGRFMDFIKKGEVDEVEPIGTVLINLNSVTDFAPWNHDLFTDQK
jgi:hypothetical protein